MSATQTPADNKPASPRSKRAQMRATYTESQLYSMTDMVSLLRLSSRTIMGMVQREEFPRPFALLKPSGGRGQYRWTKRMYEDWVKRQEATAIQ